MSGYPKMFESWACLVNTPDSTVESREYNIVNYIDTYVEYNNQKVDKLELELNKKNSEILSLKNQITLLDERLKRLEQNGGVLTTVTGETYSTELQPKINIELG